MLTATLLIIVISLLIVITLLIFIVHRIYKRRSKNNLPLADEGLCRRFLFREILSATNNFDQGLEIGRGGFGKVYKGFIDRKTKTVAIKRLSSGSKQGEKEFMSEIEVLSQHRHKHIVSLIGYCNEGREMVLVYEYMDHGTFADHLHNKKKRDGSDIGEVAVPLSWKQRLNVCLDAARGLNYLHTNSKHVIIHRDVKSENILLDRDWVAKIADFGICKVGTTSNTDIEIITDVKGTFGYLDPDYYMTRVLTKKSDVYAFGVVLWEALSGMPALDNRQHGVERSLVLWVQWCFDKGMGTNVFIDSSLRGQISTPSLKLYTDLANQCLHKEAAERPTMAEVTRGLESVLAAAATSEGEEEATDISNYFGLPYELVLRLKKSTSLCRYITLEDDDYNCMEGTPRLSYYRRFSLDEMRKATHNFSHDIGEDDFGKYFKGVIDNGITQVIIQQRKGDFVDELITMSRINHVNIVKWIGYCNKDGQMFIVLEYADNGSLSDHLHDKSKHPLPWEKRLEICIGAAQGLNYLHSHTLYVTHHDIRSCNILMDRNWVAKVSGLKSASDVLSSHISTLVCDTMDYLDPEYLMTAQLTSKSDVYSFGVVLLEVLCAKKPSEFFSEDGEKLHMVQYFRKIIKNNKIDQDVMDPRLVGNIIPECLSQYLEIAMSCVEFGSKDRPSMEAVLSGLLNVQETSRLG